MKKFDLRKIESRDKKVSIAHRLGIAAFLDERLRSPGLDPKCVALLPSIDNHTLTIAVFRAWLKGWDKANIST